MRSGGFRKKTLNSAASSTALPDWRGWRNVLLTLSQLAEQTGYSVTTLRRMIALGAVKGRRLTYLDCAGREHRGQWRFEPAEVQRAFGIDAGQSSYAARRKALEREEREALAVLGWQRPSERVCRGPRNRIASSTGPRDPAAG